MVACHYYVEPNDFSVNSILKQPLGVILLLRSPIAKPERSQPNAPLEREILTLSCA